jgi:hypothetical protein
MFMDQEIEERSDDGVVEFGRWMGRREALAMVAGRCSAAQAQAMRRVRDTKLYTQKGWTWEECCVKGFGSSRRSVERTLRLLDEYGPQYFHVAQITNVTPEEYRAIAPHVSAEGIEVEGAVIALLPENSEQVSSAVTALLNREKPVKPPPAVSADGIVKRVDALTEAMEGLAILEMLDGMKLTTAISRLCRAAARKGAATL